MNRPEETRGEKLFSPSCGLGGYAGTLLANAQGCCILLCLICSCAPEAAGWDSGCPIGTEAGGSLRNPQDLPMPVPGVSRARKDSCLSTQMARFLLSVGACQSAFFRGQQTSDVED